MRSEIEWKRLSECINTQVNDLVVIKFEGGFH